jgi:hypothetical protein
VPFALILSPNHPDLRSVLWYHAGCYNSGSGQNRVGYFHPEPYLSIYEKNAVRALRRVGMEGNCMYVNSTREAGGAAAGSHFSLSWITKTIGIQPATFDAADVIVVKTPRPDAVRQAVEALRPKPVGFCVRPLQRPVRPSTEA